MAYINLVSYSKQTVVVCPILDKLAMEAYVGLTSESRFQSQHTEITKMVYWGEVQKRSVQQSGQHQTNFFPGRNLFYPAASQACV